MQKLQIKEEIMAVVALLALGILGALATNGNVVNGQTSKVTKVTFAVCMRANDWNFNRKTVFDCATASLGLGFGGGVYVGTIKISIE